MSQRTFSTAGPEIPCDGSVCAGFLHQVEARGARPSATESAVSDALAAAMRRASVAGCRHRKAGAGAALDDRGHPTLWGSDIRIRPPSRTTS
jgi:hypothetical protein